MLTQSRFTLHPSLSLQRVASRLPFTYTGADFYALCSDAMLKAVTRQASLVDRKIAEINAANLAARRSKISTAYFFDHYASKEDVAVMVSEEDFISAERELVPSVSFKELEHYGKVRAQFEKVVEEKPQETNGKGKTPEQHEQPRPRSNGKGKGKEKMVDKKGKGKAVDSWDDGYDDEDEDPGFHDGAANGFGGKGKGKGKVVDMGFQEGSIDDDEGLY
jgi:peroxin-6